MIYTNQTGAVRCCSLDGGACKSETPDCSSLTFLEAQQKCVNFGMRLCSEQELSSNICCGTGCSFDAKLVWYTKGNLFRSTEFNQWRPFSFYGTLFVGILKCFIRGHSSNTPFGTEMTKSLILYVPMRTKHSKVS